MFIIFTMVVTIGWFFICNWFYNRGYKEGLQSSLDERESLKSIIEIHNQDIKRIKELVLEIKNMKEKK